MATTTRQLADFIVEGGVQDIAVQQNPHIQPGTLQPAIAGKLLDGSTNHSGAYGTAQSDGHSYYYTDIKGSKPIKDPRIGAHFGSQRYTFRSMQKLEQETATHGEEIFSLDGRENIRVGNFPSGSNYMVNNHWGNFFSSNRAGTFLEITGYFNDINIIIRSYTASSKTLAITVNGVTAHSALDLKSTVDSPLNVSRYVSVGMLRNIDITSSSSLSSDTALGINTIKFTMPATDIDFHGIELIAQDTSSTANKSKIQIPSQNVVSYGKKFTVSGTPHYDPFNGFTSGNLAAVQALIDIDTSLGVANWLHSGSYYRPYNGGRVVIWCDSSGNLKTSVTMMPPNAKSWNDADISKKANASVANNTYLPTFEAYTTSIGEDLLDEVAKTYNFREFGNGSANGGTGATYADFSMVTATSDALAYVMDDGLTSLSTATGSCDTTGWHFTDLSLYDTNGTAYLTFIGTGISIKDQTADGTWKFGTIAQNLPYGTHVVKLVRDGSTNGDHSVDGVACATDFLPLSYGGFSDVTFHQPKKPPVPEDACILADYMLMADYVGVPSSDSGQHSTIPKGTRMCNASRDVFYSTASGTIAISMSAIGVRERALRVDFQDITASSKEGPIITYFGHPKMSYGMASDTDASPKYELKLADSTTNVTGVTTSGSISGANITGFKVDGSSYQHISSSKSDGTLGSNTAQIRAFPDDSNDNHLYMCEAYIPSPTHTSSHYQPFETPFLNELVGGDRNMEQTNLIVTPDGKSWDEVTRKTDYLGATASFAIGHPDAGNNTGITTSSGASGSLLSLFTNRRGVVHAEHNHNKGIIMAYDRWMVKEDGWYRVSMQMRTLSGTEMAVAVYKNDIVEKYYFVLGNNNDHSGMNWSHPFYMKIGETWNVRIVGGTFRNQYDNYSSLSCVKVERS